MLEIFESFLTIVVVPNGIYVLYFLGVEVKRARSLKPLVVEIFNLFWVASIIEILANFPVTEALLVGQKEIVIIMGGSAALTFFSLRNGKRPLSAKEGLCLHTVKERICLYFFGFSTLESCHLYDLVDFTVPPLLFLCILSLILISICAFPTIVTFFLLVMARVLAFLQKSPYLEKVLFFVKSSDLTKDPAGSSSILQSQLSLWALQLPMLLGFFSAFNKYRERALLSCALLLGISCILSIQEIHIMGYSPNEWGKAFFFCILLPMEGGVAFFFLDGAKTRREHVFSAGIYVTSSLLACFVTGNGALLPFFFSFFLVSLLFLLSAGLLIFVNGNTYTWEKFKDAFFCALIEGKHFYFPLLIAILFASLNLFEPATLALLPEGSTSAQLEEVKAQLALVKVSAGSLSLQMGVRAILLFLFEKFKGKGLDEGGKEKDSEGPGANSSLGGTRSLHSQPDQKRTPSRASFFTARKLLFTALLSICALSSTKLLVYNEELLVALSFIGFLLFTRKSLGKTFQMTLDERIKAIQEELQQFRNPNEVVLLESNEKERLLRTSLRICGTVIESLPMARYAPRCEKTLQAFLCRNLNLKLATLLNAMSSRRIRLQDDLVTTFHFSVNERFVPGSTSKVSLVELIREGLAVFKMVRSLKKK